MHYNHGSKIERLVCVTKLWINCTLFVRNQNLLIVPSAHRENRVCWLHGHYRLWDHLGVQQEIVTT
jgi:hypothetical protein